MRTIIVAAVLVLTCSAGEARQATCASALHGVTAAIDCSAKAVRQARRQKLKHRLPPAPASAGPAPHLVAIARRYLGGNPIGWSRVWCGAFMRRVIREAGLPDLRDGNLARAWRRYGRAGFAQPGALVVWHGHVGILTSAAAEGKARVISGNDGHRVRERLRSIAGAVIRLPT
jgi:hypothetical protein